MRRQTANDTGCDGRTDCRVQGIFACFTPTAFDFIHKNIIFAAVTRHHAVSGPTAATAFTGAYIS